MRFSLEINCGNAAFDDAPSEVARILREAAKLLDFGDFKPGDGGGLRDANGNTVGRWRIDQ